MHEDRMRPIAVSKGISRQSLNHDRRSPLLVELDRQTALGTARRVVDGTGKASAALCGAGPMTKRRPTTKRRGAFEAAPFAPGPSVKADPGPRKPKKPSRRAGERRQMRASLDRPSSDKRPGGERGSPIEGEGCLRANNQRRVSPSKRRPPAAASASKPAQSADLPLVVGVSTRALFDLEEEHAVFVREGEEAYSALQRKRETTTLEPGCAFELVRRLLALNPPDGLKLVEVVLLSRNSPDLALRAFRSCERHGLAISEGSFTSGRSLAPFLAAWGVDLFLSNHENDVRVALAAGTAAALLGPVPPALRAEASDEVHFALDGDAVTFGAESEAIFRAQGLEAFDCHERRNARKPLTRGPFGGALLHKLVELRRRCMRPDRTSRLRISMVTARSAPAHERVIRTLRRWNMLFDEVHFLGHRAKASFLAAAGAHIFFDDRKAHVEAASRFVPSGRVPELLSPQRRRNAKAR
jgi:5'-nucleotidase